MKDTVKKYSLLVLVAGAVILLDQVTKAIIRANLGMGDMWSPWEWLTPFARIVHWYNTGVAFGLFQGMGSFFTILAIIVAIAIIYYYPRVPAEEKLMRLAMGMQLGGAMGNLIDRITVGHVTDFISVGTFPVFNIADASISIGVVVLIFSVWLQENRMKRQQQDNPDGTDPAESAFEEFSSTDNEAA